MRLLHTTTIKLSSFDNDDSIPTYAILSHTWGNAELLFHDLLNYAESQLNESEGYQKIRSCCALAAAEGHEYVWIDTCCIDKTSSQELSEAINSMYRWYQEAQICYAYLADVDIGDHSFGSTNRWEAFRKSRWFTRGWTLQELLAPKDLVFYDKLWREFGSKSSLMDEISLATGIQHYQMEDSNRASVAQKMSWASKRQTRRVEDMAYSLMGIFDVNMPLLYGEGKKAFMRLQHEIVKISNDESLFAWTDGGLVESGLLAQSPKAFAESGDVFQISSREQSYIYRAPHMVTNRGLAIEASCDSCDSRSTSILDRRFAFLPLNCKRNRPMDDFPNILIVNQLAIRLEKVSRDEFVRFSPGQLDTPSALINRNTRSLGLVYIRPGFVSCISHEPRLSLFIDPSPRFIDPSSLSKYNPSFRLLDSYGCLPEQQWTSLTDETLWRITLGSGHKFAAILLQSHDPSIGQRFAIMVHVTESKISISLITVSLFINFYELMDAHERRQDCDCSAHPAPIRLQNNCWVSMALREKQVGLSQKHYLAEFVPTGDNDTLVPEEIATADGQPSSGHVIGKDQMVRKILTQDEDLNLRWIESINVWAFQIHDTNACIYADTKKTKSKKPVTYVHVYLPGSYQTHLSSSNMRVTIRLKQQAQKTTKQTSKDTTRNPTSFRRTRRQT